MGQVLQKCQVPQVESVTTQGVMGTTENEKLGNTKS